jgi:hypothetical protein
VLQLAVRIEIFTLFLLINRKVTAENENFVFSQTESGWQNKASYLGYVKTIDKWAEEKNIQRPILIFADGHKSHLDLELYRFCKSRDIIYVILYPNSTHILAM